MRLIANFLSLDIHSFLYVDKNREKVNIYVEFPIYVTFLPHIQLGPQNHI